MINITKLLGALSVFGSSLILFGVVMVGIKESDVTDSFPVETFVLLSSLAVLAFSSIGYAFLTNFWKSKSKVEEIEIENEFLKKQIEQKELKSKLDK